jgi:ERCC4-type nuclease
MIYYMVHEQPMVVYVDDRENDLVIHKLIARLGDKKIDPKGHMQIKRLPTADYIMGEWGIEAKEINDLYHSILGHGRSRTIVGQLMDLQENFEHPVLAVYGTKLKPYVKYRGGGAVAQEMMKMKRVIKVFKQDFLLRFPKIKYMQVDSMDDFVDYIVNMHNKLRIAGHHTWDKDLYRLKCASPNADPRIAALAALPGITEHMANDLMSKFGSIPNLLRARRTQAALMTIKGIGRQKAKLILSLRDKV